VANCVDKVAAELAKAEAEAEAGTEAYQACYSGCGSAAMIKTSAVLFVTLIVLAAMV
jgi:hypothetical protein